MTFKALDGVLQRSVWVAQLFILGVGVILSVQLLDRRPPFAVLPHAPFTVQAGQWANLVVPVQRDLSRTCDATFSRYIFDSQGQRFDVVAQAEASDEFIREMERRNPGQLQMGFPIPPLRSSSSGGITTGPARLVTSLSYRCYKVNALWPITVTTTVDLLVLP